MSNKNNDNLIDNLIDRMENLGIFDLLVTNDKGFLLKDLEEIEDYILYFESLKPTEDNYFWCLDMLKAKHKSNERRKQMIKVIPEFVNSLQHAYYQAELTKTDGKIDTNTEFGEIKDETNNQDSYIL